MRKLDLFNGRIWPTRTNSKSTNSFRNKIKIRNHVEQVEQKLEIKTFKILFFDLSNMIADF